MRTDSYDQVRPIQGLRRIAHNRQRPTVGDLETLVKVASIFDDDVMPSIVALIMAIGRSIKHFRQ